MIPSGCKTQTAGFYDSVPSNVVVASVDLRALSNGGLPAADYWLYDSAAGAATVVSLRQWI